MAGNGRADPPAYRLCSDDDCSPVPLDDGQCGRAVCLPELAGSDTQILQGVAAAADQLPPRRRVVSSALQLISSSAWHDASQLSAVEWRRSCPASSKALRSRRFVLVGWGSEGQLIRQSLPAEAGVDFFSWRAPRCASGYICLLARLWRVYWYRPPRSAQGVGE